MQVQQRLAVVLAVVAGALLAALVLLASIARLGGAIAAEIRYAQTDYLNFAHGSPLAEANALKLGQCLRRAMQKVALTRAVRSDAWLIATRVEALPACQRGLAPLADLSTRAAANFESASGVVVAAPANQLSRRP